VRHNQVSVTALGMEGCCGSIHMSCKVFTMLAKEGRKASQQDPPCTGSCR
jgi:hypothetical protein